MSYATRQDMELQFGATELQHLTDIAYPPAGAINDAVLTRVLDDASVWIDGYLATRYPTPIVEPSVLPLLRLHCCNVSRFFLMRAQADDAATAAFNDAKAYFMAVAKGQINLLQPAAAPQQQGVGSVEFDAGTKHFGRSTNWRDC
jgi:phage gp36-like protein